MAAQIRALLSHAVDGSRLWDESLERVKKVVLKLARGHLDYELSIQEIGEPATVLISPLQSLSAEQRIFFENPEPGPLAVWPELGSRAFIRVFEEGPQTVNGWLVVQHGRYRYLVGQTQGNFVHILLGEFLACRVVWE